MKLLENLSCESHLITSGTPDVTKLIVVSRFVIAL
jgi:hypothetical protein